MAKYATASRYMALKDNDARERGRGIFVSADGGLIGTGAAPLGWPAWDYQQSAHYNGRGLMQGDQPWSDGNVWTTTIDDFDLCGPDYSDEMEDWDVAPCRPTFGRFYGEWEHEALHVPILAKGDSGRPPPEDTYARQWEADQIRAMKDAERDAFREQQIEMARESRMRAVKQVQEEQEIEAALNARMREYRVLAREEGKHGTFTIRVKKSGRSLTVTFTMNTRGQTHITSKVWA